MSVMGAEHKQLPLLKAQAGPTTRKTEGHVSQEMRSEHSPVERRKEVCTDQLISPQSGHTRMGWEGRIHSVEGICSSHLEKHAFHGAHLALVLLILVPKLRIP